MKSETGNCFIVFLEDKKFGVVSKKTLVNIAVSELKDNVYGMKCEAMYADNIYRATLIFRGKSMQLFGYVGSNFLFKWKLKGGGVDRVKSLSIDPFGEAAELLISDKDGGTTWNFQYKLYNVTINLNLIIPIAAESL